MNRMMFTNVRKIVTRKILLSLKLYKLWQTRDQLSLSLFLSSYIFEQGPRGPWDATTSILQVIDNILFINAEFRRHRNIENDFSRCSKKLQDRWNKGWTNGRSWTDGRTYGRTLPPKKCAVTFRNDHEVKLFCWSTLIIAVTIEFHKLFTFWNSNIYEKKSSTWFISAFLSF